MSDKETYITGKEQMECAKSNAAEESDHNAAAAAFAISPSNDPNTTNNTAVTGEEETVAAFPEAEREVDANSTQNIHADTFTPETQSLVSKEVEAVSSIAEALANTKEKEIEQKTMNEPEEHNKEEKEETNVNVIHHERLMRHLRRYRQQQPKEKQERESFANKEHIKPQPSSSTSASPQQHAEEWPEASSSSSLSSSSSSSSSTSSSSTELEEEEEESTKEKAEQERRRGHAQNTRLATKLSRSVSIRGRQHMLSSHSKNSRGLPSIVSLHPSHQRHQAFHNNLRRERYDQHQHQHERQRQRQRQRRAKQRDSNVLHKSQLHQTTLLELEQNYSSEHHYNKPHQEQTSSESSSVQSNDHVIAIDTVDVHDRKDIKRKEQNKLLRRRRDRNKRIKHHVLPPLHHAIAPSHYNATYSDDEQVRRVRRGKHIHADNSFSDDSRAYSLDEGEVQLRVHEMHQEREAEIEESVWREMQEIEQATQQWERMIGAMHTNTILQTEQASLSSESSSNRSKSQERNVKHGIHSHHHPHHHHHWGETKSQQISGDNNNIESRDRNKNIRSKPDESTSHASHSYQSSARKVKLAHNTANKLVNNKNKNDDDRFSEDIHQEKKRREKRRHHGKRSSATHKNSIISISGSNNSSSRNTNKQSRGSSTNRSLNIRSSSSNIDSSSTNTDKRPSRSTFQRMHFGVLQDPRNAIINMILSSTSGSIDIHDIHERFHWEDEYEHVYGSVAEYLQSYQAIFVTSPIDDRVTLRRTRVTSQIAERLRKDDDEIEEEFYSHRALMARAKRSLSLLKFSEEDELIATAASSNPEIHTKQSMHTKERNNDTIYNKRNISRRTVNRPIQHNSAIRANSSRGRSVRRRQLTSGSALLPWSDLTLTAAAAHIGSISYSCVAEEFALEELETIYRRRGYEVNEFCDALHIHAACKFDLFLFSNGVVVWWGHDRSDHWMVEDDFLSHTSYVREAMKQRYSQKDIEVLFPCWCTFEYDEWYGEADVQLSPLGYTQATIDDGLERFAQVLCFDHYTIPFSEPARRQVMLALSHCFGRSARADYFEYITQWSHRRVLSIPKEISGLLDYYSNKRRITKLEGELQVALLGITSLKDSPEFLWEMPWLQPYYDLAEGQLSSEQRLLWFSARSDALLEQLSDLKTRRFRLFMLGSDVFLIVLLIIDVFFLCARLIVAMYFNKRNDE